MFYRLMFSAAVASCVLWLVDRENRRSVVAAHRIGDDHAGFDLIARVLQQEQARQGGIARCTVSRGLAVVQASRAAQARIAAGLRQSHLSVTPAQPVY
jgi:hypothetical protein